MNLNSQMATFIDHIFMGMPDFSAHGTLSIYQIFNEGRRALIVSYECSGECQCQARVGRFDKIWHGVRNASNKKCIRRGISNLVNLKNGQKQPHLRNQTWIHNMKFSAFSVAAVFAFFAQTMAEPFPQGTPPIVDCTTTSFPCRSSMNISVHALVSNWFLKGGGPCVS